MIPANPLDFTGKAVLITGGGVGWTGTPTDEWIVVPMVSGTGLKIPGS